MHILHEDCYLKSGIYYFYKFDYYPISLGYFYLLFTDGKLLRSECVKEEQLFSWYDFIER